MRTVGLKNVATRWYSALVSRGNTSTNENHFIWGPKINPRIPKLMIVNNYVFNPVTNEIDLLSHQKMTMYIFVDGLEEDSRNLTSKWRLRSDVLVAHSYNFRLTGRKWQVSSLRAIRQYLILMISQLCHLNFRKMQPALK